MSNHALDAAYPPLQLALAHVGYFRRGTVLRRFIPCGKPGCRCQNPTPKLHGPYYQWTRKVAGKTVTVRLTHDEAALMARWIAAGRELDRVLARMERLSLRATDRILRDLRRQAPHPAARRGPRRTRGLPDSTKTG